MGAVSLTERRKQFLQGLLDLYHHTELPVHYEALAKRLGVSKWTAYDMLKELEKQGLLTRDYAVNASETGRSQVVFVPTRQAEALFSHERTTVLQEEELAEIKRDALQVLQGLQAVTPAEAVQQVMQKIPRIEVRVTFCAYLLGMLVTLLRTLDRKSVSTLWRLAQTAPEQNMRLAMFAGSAVGAILQIVGDGLSGELVDFVGRFLQEVSDLTEAEREMLLGVIEEAIDDQPQ